MAAPLDVSRRRCCGLLMAARVALVALAAAAAVTPSVGSCAYDEGSTDGFNSGVNAGGLYFCSSDGTLDGALSGTALRDACAAMCDTDDSCVMFEVGAPAWAAFYQGIGDIGREQCVVDAVAGKIGGCVNRPGADFVDPICDGTVPYNNCDTWSAHCVWEQWDVARAQAYCESLPWAEAANCALEFETLAEAQNLVDRESPSNCQKEIPCWTVHEKTSPACGSPIFTGTPVCTRVNPTIDYSEPDKVSRAQDWVAAGCKLCTLPEEEGNCEQQQLLDALGEDCSGASPLLHIYIGAAIGVGIAIGEHSNLI
jgi:hypothetical protein